MMESCLLACLLLFQKTRENQIQFFFCLDVPAAPNGCCLNFSFFFFVFLELKKKAGKYLYHIYIDLTVCKCIELQ